MTQQSAELCQTEESVEKLSWQLFVPHACPGIQSSSKSQSPLPSLHGCAAVQQDQSPPGMAPSQKMLKILICVTSRVFTSLESHLFVGLLGPACVFRNASVGTFSLSVLSQIMSENFRWRRWLRAAPLNS